MKYTTVGLRANSDILLKKGWGEHFEKKKHALFIIHVIN